MNTNEGTIGVVIEGLVPGTTYTVVIQAVNGAMRNNGLGMASEPDTGITESGKCTDFNSLFVYVIGGSVVLFGKNRVLKLAVVNKIV